MQAEQVVERERLAVGVREAAEMIGVSERFLWTLIQSGEIPHKRVGRRMLVVVNGLRSWLANGEAATTH